MKAEYAFESDVCFSDVDHSQQMHLPKIFEMLQDMAVTHADSFGIGPQAVTSLGAAWVLSKVSLSISQYPKLGEPVMLETWSTGVRGFRGYREFRISSSDTDPQVVATSLWVWMDLRTRSVALVPKELASLLPEGYPDKPWHRDDIDRMRCVPPAADAPSVAIAVRQSDYDAHSHVNNTAFIDFIHTGLHRLGLISRIRKLDIQFLREIPMDVASVNVRGTPTPGGIAVAISGPDGDYATALVG
jgi:acyl-ACP thioesterase